MTASRVFLYFCLSFIIGIFVSSLAPVSRFFILGLLILGIFLISIFWHVKKLVVIGFCVLFLVLGIGRHQTIESAIPNITEQNINFVGVVSEEPDIRDKYTKLIVETTAVEGKVLVNASRYPEYQYGDQLKITGKLEKPPIFDNFNYHDYLKKDGIFTTMNFPEISLAGQNSGHPIYQAIFSFKNKFKETARKFILPPQVGLLEALIFGDEGGISKEWRDKLNLTGTRHIAAVSGMNITIISVLILNFLLALGLWRKQAFYFTVVLLVLYVLMVGAPASAVRAGIMGGLFLTARHLGRMSAAFRAIVFAGTVMLAFNPLLLRLDIGFQLSFLAITGIIELQPVFSKFLKKIPDYRFFPIKTTLAATFSAQIFTLPILIYNFGRIPILSPITNILIVPFLAPITVLIFVFGITSMIFSPLGYVLSWPVWFSLSYMTNIIDVFSKLPKIW